MLRDCRQDNSASYLLCTLRDYTLYGCLPRFCPFFCGLKYGGRPYSNRVTIGISVALARVVQSGQHKLYILGKALNVSEAWLMGYDVPMQTESPVPSNTYPLDDIKFVNVPVIGSVAAGTGCLADNEIIGYEPTDYDDVKDGQEYRYLTVKGDSMYPKFEEGDLVLVRCQSSVDSGSYAVVLIDDEEGVIKKIVYGPNFIELHSINPMYPVRRFENENVLRIRVFGLVRSIKRKL